MICHSKRFLYLHVPRTGGTSIGRALEPFCEIQPHGSTHWTYGDWVEKFPCVREYFVAISVRNPWDQVVSHHEYRRQRGVETDIEADARLCGRPRDFGMCRADMILRTESLQADFLRFCEAVGLPSLELRRINWRERTLRHYRDYFTCEAKRIVDRRFELTINLCDYAF